MNFSSPFSLENAMRPLRFNLLGLSALLLATSCDATSIAAKKSTQPPVNLSTGVVVAMSEQRIYTTHPDGHVQANALTDGAGLWTCAQIGLAVGAIGDHLLIISGRAQDVGPGKGKLAIVQASTGKVEQSLDLSFPAKVFANPFAAPLRQFVMRQETSADGSLLLTWDYHAQPLRGAVLTDEDSQAAVDVDLRGAFLLSVDGDQFRLGAKPASAAVTRSIELVGDERLANVNARQFRSADDSHVLASAPEADPIFGTRYRWTLYQRTSSTALGALTQNVSTAPFLVSGKQLLTNLSPVVYRNQSGEMQALETRLASFDLSTGQQSYVIPILDLTYRGVMPP
jgi:hypothetical protein